MVEGDGQLLVVELMLRQDLSNFLKQFLIGGD